MSSKLLHQFKKGERVVFGSVTFKYLGGGLFHIEAPDDVRFIREVGAVKVVRDDMAKRQSRVAISSAKGY